MIRALSLGLRDHSGLVRVTVEPNRDVRSGGSPGCFTARGLPCRSGEGPMPGVWARSCWNRPL